MKPAILRQAATADVEHAFTHYMQEAGAVVAREFVASVDGALTHIERYPASGSPRYGELCDIPGLRTWLLNRFPYLLAYIEHGDYLDVLRVLHQHADIPVHLTDAEVSQ